MLIEVYLKKLDGVLGMESTVLIMDDPIDVWPHDQQNMIHAEKYTYFPLSRSSGPSLLEIDQDESLEDGLFHLYWQSWREFTTTSFPNHIWSKLMWEPFLPRSSTVLCLGVGYCLVGLFQLERPILINTHSGKKLSSLVQFVLIRYVTDEWKICCASWLVGGINYAIQKEKWEILVSN